MRGINCGRPALGRSGGGPAIASSHGDRLQPRLLHEQLQTWQGGGCGARGRGRGWCRPCGAAPARVGWGRRGGRGEREAAGARIGSGRRGTGAGERDEGELAREREELAIAFICDGGAGRRGCRVSSAAVERAGEGAVGHRRRWSRGARVRWVVGGGGAGEGAGGRRRRPVERGRGCGGCSAARGTGSGEVG